MITYQKEQDKLTILFQDSLDTTACINFEEELYDRIKEEGCPVIFDLTQVDSISSMFLRVCTKTAKYTGNDKLAIINAREPVMKIFKLTKLDNFLSISTLP